MGRTIGKLCFALSDVDFVQLESQACRSGCTGSDWSQVLLEPPQEDEIEEKLERLKKFNKKISDKKNENDAKMESEVLKVEADEIDENKRSYDVKKTINKKGKEISDMDDLLGKNLAWWNDLNMWCWTRGGRKWEIR